VGEAVESIAHEDSQSIDFNELCTALSIWAKECKFSNMQQISSSGIGRLHSIESLGISDNIPM
jgi:hypothetical protein